MSNFYEDDYNPYITFSLVICAVVILSFIEWERVQRFFFTFVELWKVFINLF